MTAGRKNAQTERPQVNQVKAFSSKRKRGPWAEVPPKGMFTKGQIRAALPKSCFEKSYAAGLWVLLMDVFCCVGATAALLFCQANLPPACMLLIAPLYWYYQGINFTAIWVIAHECGHGSFVPHYYANEFIGWTIHSFLICPYQAWKLTHATHHRRTNSIPDGETWVPATANPNKPKVKFYKSFWGVVLRITVTLTMGWYAYLFTNVTGARKHKGWSHFNPAAPLFEPHHRNQILLSNLGFCLGILGTCYSVYVFGFWQTFLVYWMPKVIADMYLVVITFMHHTNEDVAHFQSDEWTWLRGAINTIDRTMGSWVDRKLHHITDTHVVHHLFTDMSFIGALEATPIVKELLGKYYKSKLDTNQFEYAVDAVKTFQFALTTQENEDNFWFYE